MRDADTEHDKTKQKRSYIQMEVPNYGVATFAYSRPACSKSPSHSVGLR